MTEHDDISVLAAAVQDLVPEWRPWPGGWQGQIEAALIDAVLSIRASYGLAHNGVRAAVSRWRTRRGAEKLDDLEQLATMVPDELAATLANQQHTSGRLKAGALVEAAHNLVAEGVRHASDVDPQSAAHKHGYTSVHGLGQETWEYFLMLLGTPSIKADTWILRFVTQALGRTVSPAEARELLKATAAALQVDPSTLDHSIWFYMRRRGRSAGNT